MDDEGRLTELARAILEGASVDWESQSAQAEATQRPVLAAFRLLQRVVDAHRQEPPDTAVPFAWGPLALVGKIGEGAFADVYRARDVRLDREVALKLLRPSLADTGRDTAFIEEGRLLARVRHPNVVTVYGAERIDGRVGIWMELVDGRTLEEELRLRGPFQAEEVARIGVDILRALGAVHAAGLLHRDVKAQNVLRDADGRILLADFGAGRDLASFCSGGGTGAPRQHTGDTLAPEPVGTPVYLAPEVFAGEEATPRSDIYGVGVLLFHLLTGSYPVRGATLGELREAHALNRRVRLREVRPHIPKALAHVVERATEADPRARYGSAGEMEAALTRLSSGPRRGTPAGRGRRYLPPALAAALLVSVAAVTAILFLARAAPAPVTLARHVRITSEPGLQIDPVLSPDGRHVAYSSGQPGHMRVVIRELATGRAINATAAALGDERRPRWAPDGRELLFSVGGLLCTVTADGGGTATVRARGSRIRSAAWARDGRSILFFADTGLYRVGAHDSTVVLVRPIEYDAVGLALSPDGDRIAYSTGNQEYSIGTTNFANSGPSAIRIATMRGTGSQRLTEADSVNVSPAWSADGRSLFFVSNRDGHRDIYRLPIGDREAIGPAERVTSGLEAHDLSISSDGRDLVYSVLHGRANVWSVPIPESGTATFANAREVTRGNQTVEDCRVSPDGRWLYFDSNREGNFDVYRMPMEGGEPQRLTSDRRDEFLNDVSPDGRELTFHRFEDGKREVYEMPSAGGPAAFVADGLGAMWSADGSRLLLAKGETPELQGATVVLLERSRDRRWGAARQLIDRRYSRPRWSADGRTLVGLFEGRIVQLDLTGRAVRTLYEPVAPGDPVPREIKPLGNTMYMRSYGSDGAALFWSLEAGAGTRPRLLLRIEDAERVASRPTLDTDGHRLFFTIEERQGDAWIARFEPR